MGNVEKAVSGKIEFKMMSLVNEGMKNKLVN